MSAPSASKIISPALSKIILAEAFEIVLLLITVLSIVKSGAVTPPEKVASPPLDIVNLSSFAATSKILKLLEPDIANLYVLRPVLVISIISAPADSISNSLGPVLFLFKPTPELDTRNILFIFEMFAIFI